MKPKTKGFIGKKEVLDRLPLVSRPPPSLSPSHVIYGSLRFFLQNPSSSVLSLFLPSNHSATAAILPKLRNLSPPLISRQNKLAVTAIQVSDLSENYDDSVLEDVPHLTDFLPNLPVPLRFLSFSICFHDCDFVDKHVIDKSFGFNTAVEEAHIAINAAHGEVENVENGVGIVELMLMGRYNAKQYFLLFLDILYKLAYAGFIAMYATLASRDVNLSYLSSYRRQFQIKLDTILVLLMLKMKSRAVLMPNPSDPTYMIRAIASNASDNIYCTLLAHGAVHGAMAGYTGFTVGPVNSKQAYIPIACVMEKQNKVKLTDRMWARLLASTNQPSFVAYDQERVEKDINNMNITSQTRFNRYFD
ncbi:ATP-dependent 6-phosphofructokinase 4, chloroplastic [Glycine max]|nr:ATP-dependent 6-phosphofructokinase 4, chloroplastic [Glycine max]